MVEAIFGTEQYRLDIKNNTLTVSLKTEVKDSEGNSVEVTGKSDLIVKKVAYNIYLDEFEEVAHSTGASYERTLKDFGRKCYVLEDMEDDINKYYAGMRSDFGVYFYDKDGKIVNESDIKDFFSKIRPGDMIDYQIHWFFSGGGRTVYYNSNEFGHKPLKFFGLPDDPSKPDNPNDSYHYEDMERSVSDNLPMDYSSSGRGTILGRRH